MHREHYSPGNYESSNNEGKEILLSELETIFPELAADIIDELELHSPPKDQILVLYSDGSVQVK